MSSLNYSSTTTSAFQSGSVSTVTATAQTTFKIPSSEIYHMFENINDVALCGFIGAFGVISNVVNIIVFAKDLKNTVNITLMALGFADFFGLLTLLWISICKNPILRTLGFPFYRIYLFDSLTGIWPHMCLARITCWVTAHATAERWLCIAFPLTCKRFLTPMKTFIVIIFIFISMFSAFAPRYEAFAFRLSNRTRSGFRPRVILVEIPNRDYREMVSFIVNASLSMASFVAVVGFTLTLAITLRQKSKHRAKASLVAGKTAEALSNRDARTISMILTISIVLILCYTPGMVLSWFSAIDSNLTIHSIHSNLFGIMWTFSNLLEAINSSVNIFFYYKMSSKYRKTFRSLFPFIKKKSHGINQVGKL